LIAGILSRMEPTPNFLEVAQRSNSAPLTRHGQEFWRQAVRDHESSGLSLSQFCLERGLAKATFFKWRTVLRQQLYSSLPTPHQEVQSEIQSLPGFLAVPLSATPTSPAKESPQFSARTDAEHQYRDAKLSIKLGGVDVALTGHYADRVMRIITERLSGGGFR
jgi:transposase-like protein